MTNELKEINGQLSTLWTDENQIETSEAASDVGPLKTLSLLFNTNMDTIVKWFVIIIILIFDPLGVLLIISFNKISIEGRDEYLNKNNSNIITTELNDNLGILNDSKDEKEHNKEEEAEKSEPVDKQEVLVEKLKSEKEKAKIDKEVREEEREKAKKEYEDKLNYKKLQSEEKLPKKEEPKGSVKILTKMG